MANPKRLGRDFERLVHVMETLAQTGARVEFDARVRDVRTGKLRQVDVATWIPSGHGELLYMIECKDLTRPVGVAVVEQVWQKAADVHAARAAIVSPIGFTADARSKAAHLGLDLLTLAEGEDWPDWILLRTIQVHRLLPELHGIRLLADGYDGKVPSQTSPFDLSAPVIRTSGGDGRTAGQLLNQFLNSGGREQLEAMGGVESRRVTLKLRLADGPCVAIYPGVPDDFEVTAVDLDISFRVELHDLKLRLTSFRDSEGNELSQAFVADPFDFGFGPKRMVLNVRTKEDGGSQQINMTMVDAHEGR